MIQVEYFKWIHINRFFASKDASTWKAHGDTSKQKDKQKGGEIGKERASKTSRVKWGEENERQMANNVNAREMGL